VLYGTSSGSSSGGGALILNQATSGIHDAIFSPPTNNNYFITYLNVVSNIGDSSTVTSLTLKEIL